MQSTTKNNTGGNTTVLQECLSGYDLPHLIDKAKQSDTPYFVISRNRLREQFKKLSTYLPMVKPHFAIKSLPLAEAIQVLHAEGAHFDVASNEEIDLLSREHVIPEKVIHTHPIKRKSDIEYALNFGIQTFVIDNLNELEKFIPYKDKVKLLVRLSFPNHESQCDLSSKFGMPPAEVIELLSIARNHGIQIAGCSFHVGSNTFNNRKFLIALETCRKIYTIARELNMHFTLLDIGGGFPSYQGQAEEDELSYFSPIAKYLSSHFAMYDVISEPGRYISGSSGILLCKVIGKSVRQQKRSYYLNDGVYNNFSGMIFDHSNYPIFSEHCLENKGAIYCESILFGPTCDNIDTISDSILLPELEVNDILVATHIGAYSRASATHFNFLGHTNILLTD